MSQPRRNPPPPPPGQSRVPFHPQQPLYSAPQFNTQRPSQNASSQSGPKRRSRSRSRSPRSRSPRSLRRLRSSPGARRASSPRSRSPVRRRSRSRSRSPRHNRGSNKRDWRRSRSPSWSRSPSPRNSRRTVEEGDNDGQHQRTSKKAPEMSPSDVLVVRGLHMNVAEEDLMYAVKIHSAVKEVRVIRDKDTGQSRGYGFIVFFSVEEAEQFLNITNYKLEILGRIANMEFSNSSSSSHHSTAQAKDWNCLSCGFVNYARRLECHRCRADKKGGQRPSKEEPTNPTMSLILYGLPPHVQEKDIHTAVLPICNRFQVKAIRDKQTNQSRGFAFLDFTTIEDSVHVFRRSDEIVILGIRPRVEFARSGHSQGAGQNSTAPDAIAASMCMNYSFNGQESESGEAQQTSDWVWMAEYGLYYQYSTQSYFYYDEKQQTYLPYNGGNDATKPVNKQTDGDIANSAAKYDKDGEWKQRDDDANANVHNQHEEILLIQKARPTQNFASNDSVTDIQSSNQDYSRLAEVETNQTEQYKEMDPQDSEYGSKKKPGMTINEKKTLKAIEVWSQKSKEMRAPTKQPNQEANPNPTESAPAKISFKIGKASAEQPTPVATKNIIMDDPAEDDESQATANIIPPNAILPRSISSGLKSVLAASAAATTTSHLATPTTAVAPTNVATEHIEQKETALMSTGTAVDVAEVDWKNYGLDMKEFICNLCRRKFKSIDQIEKHRDLSDLHKSNLEMERVQAFQREKMAQQRKKDSVRAAAEAREATKARNQPKPSSEADKKPAALDESNIGHQMMQRMGWKEGDGLGANSTGIVEAIRVKSRTGRTGLGMGVDVETDPGDSYQDVARKKARARLQNMD